MKSEYVTVKQAAEILGVTPQGIYKRLKALSNQDNQFNNEVETVKGGKKLVNIEVLADLMGIEINEVEEVDKLFNEVQQPFNEVDNQVNDEIIAILKAEIEHLREENKSLVKLIDQQQQLTLAAESRLALLEHKNQAEEVEPGEPEPVKQAEEVKEPGENKKRGFLERLFG